MLQPRIAILNVDPVAFCELKRRISSSCGRLRKKNVPVNCLRSARRTTRCRIVPQARNSLVCCNPEGSCVHNQAFSRMYRPIADLFRIKNAAPSATECAKLSPSNRRSRGFFRFFHKALFQSELPQLVQTPRSKIVQLTRAFIRCRSA